MPWIDDINTAVTAAELAAAVFRNSKMLVRQYKRLRRLVTRRGSVRVPVFGAGGVGKTTIKQIFSGEIDFFDVRTEYRQSSLPEQAPLTGDGSVGLAVLPGQDSADWHWREELSRIDVTKDVCVINVTAFGFHSFSMHSIQEHPIVHEAPSLDPTTFVHRYLDQRRQQELTLADRLCRGLDNIQNRLYVITLVNKQDLWWTKRAEVRTYYDSVYADRFAPLRNRLGDRFTHWIIPMSLTIESLRTVDGELIAPNSEGYDMRCHYGYALNAFRRIGALLKDLGDRS